MKTAEQQLKRMKDLVRKMANRRVGLDVMQNIEDYLEAQLIVSELPEPISKDTLEARALVAKYARWFSVDEEMAKNIEGGKWDYSRAGLVHDVAEALRRAR